MGIENGFNFLLLTLFCVKIARKVKSGDRVEFVSK